MKIHLIAIGGSIMHNLAIALKKRGYELSGSDDEIYEPAKSRLAALNLLPANTGWFPEKITSDINTIILGMHAREDNPELLRAKELGLKIVSFPEFIYEESKDKLRVVIAGSHGKTTTTSMVMHVLKHAGKKFDYAVGSSIEGFEDSVKLSQDAASCIIEGDEYLTSPIDRRPKFLWYQPQISYLSGIAWDHINVFPTYENYFQQFVLFLQSLEKGATFIYNPRDKEVVRLVKNYAKHLRLLDAPMPMHRVEGGRTIVRTEGREVRISVFGEHNLQNLAGAQKICEQLEIHERTFWDLVQDFKGAGKRLQKIYEDKNLVAFRDFAHAPSKVEATVAAVKEQYGNKKLIAALELHTFSSLNPEFIKQYAGTMDKADEAIVYINPETQKSKHSNPISAAEIQDAFKKQNLVFTEDADRIKSLLHKNYTEPTSLLLMSSGNFDGMNFELN